MIKKRLNKSTSILIGLATSTLLLVGGCMHHFKTEQLAPQIEGMFWQPDLATTAPTCLDKSADRTLAVKDIYVANSLNVGVI